MILQINSLTFFEEDFGIRIEEYAATKGRIPPIKRRKGCSIYVATIEKANMLINSLIETENLDSIGLLVIDELHMVGDGARGVVLEQQLVKYQFKGWPFVYPSNKFRVRSNSRNVCHTIQYARSRPVSRCLRLFDRLSSHRTQRIRQIGEQYVPSQRRETSLGRRSSRKCTVILLIKIQPFQKLEKFDPDGVIQLLQGVIPNKSVIIFCPTKKNCENVALLIAKYVPQ